MCKSRATHRAIITCNASCASWHERTAQLLSLTEFNPIYFSFILLAKPLTADGFLFIIISKQCLHCLMLFVLLRGMLYGK